METITKKNLAEAGMGIAESNFADAGRMLSEFSTPENFRRIADATGMMVAALSGGGQIVSCGNGGSLCDAAHFAEELTARFRSNRRALRATAITDAAFLTCVGNDFGFDRAFARYIEAYGEAGDVLLAISTSGDSPNVLAAAAEARSKGMKVVALTGKSGGKLAAMCDVEIRAPHSEFSDRVQEIHIKVIHTLCQMIEAQLGLDK